jgi:hypothetical protein
MRFALLAWYRERGPTKGIIDLLNLFLGIEVIDEPQDAVGAIAVSDPSANHDLAALEVLDLDPIRLVRPGLDLLPRRFATSPSSRCARLAASGTGPLPMVYEAVRHDGSLSPSSPSCRLRSPSRARLNGRH